MFESGGRGVREFSHGRGRGGYTRQPDQYRNNQNVTDHYGHSQGNVFDYKVDRKVRRKANKVEAKQQKLKKHEAYIENKRREKEERQSRKWKQPKTKKEKLNAKKAYEMAQAKKRGIVIQESVSKSSRKAETKVKENKTISNDTVAKKAKTSVKKALDVNKGKVAKKVAASSVNMKLPEGVSPYSNPYLEGQDDTDEEYEEVSDGSLEVGSDRESEDEVVDDINTGDSTTKNTTKKTTLKSLLEAVENERDALKKQDPSALSKRNKHMGIEAVENGSGSLPTGKKKYIPPAVMAAMGLEKPQGIKNDKEQSAEADDGTLFFKKRHAHPIEIRNSAKILPIVRAYLSKLAIGTVSSIIIEISDLFTDKGYPRAEVMLAVVSVVVGTVINTDIQLTAQNAAPFVGLIRGLQLLHGNSLIAPFLEHLVRITEDALEDCGRYGPTLRGGVHCPSNSNQLVEDLGDGVTKTTVRFDNHSFLDNDSSNINRRYNQVALAKAESVVENGVIFFGALFLVSCVEFSFLMSLVAKLVGVATNTSVSTTDTNSSALLFLKDETKTRTKKCGNAESNYPESMSAAASKCAFTLLKLTGPTLRKVCPAQLNAVVNNALTVQKKNGLAESADNDTNDSGQVCNSQTRSSVLMQLVRDVASGRYEKLNKAKKLTAHQLTDAASKAKVSSTSILLAAPARKAEDNDDNEDGEYDPESISSKNRDDDEVFTITVLNLLVSVVQKIKDAATGVTSNNRKKGTNKSAGPSKKSSRQAIASLHVMPKLSWNYVLSTLKDEQWHVEGGTDDDLEGLETEEDASHSSVGHKRDRQVVNDNRTSEESEEESADDEITATAACIKRESIKKIREEEKALAGQHFTSELKRELFKLVISASDDMECFSMLMNRDHKLTHSPDIAEVLVQCCCQSTTYNPYFAKVLLRIVLSSKKGATTRKGKEEHEGPGAVGVKGNRVFKKALQYAIWDKFKQIRVGNSGRRVDIVTMVNLSCLVGFLFSEDIFGLALLRGLDLDDGIDRNTGLFSRILILRLCCELEPTQLTSLFFGGSISSGVSQVGDGDSGLIAHDINIDTKPLRKAMRKFLAVYFLDDNESKKWIPLFIDVVSFGTQYDTSHSKNNTTGVQSRPLTTLPVRFKLIDKALREGI